MVEKIFVKSGEEFKPVALRKFKDEKPLKKLLIENAHLIPLDEIYPKTKPKLYPISSELNTNHGRLDIIGIDQHGEIYIIETKLDDNKTVREIICQILDYASGLRLIRNEFDEFKARIKEANLSKYNKGTRLERKTLEQIIEKIDDLEFDLLPIIKKNFENSKFTYVVVLDEISEELKENILLHNEKNENPLYAIVLSYYKPDDFSNEIIISSIFGVESVEKKSGSGNRRKWMEEGDQQFIKLINANSKLSEEQKNILKNTFEELREILGGKPESDLDVGYYNWGDAQAPRFHARFYAHTWNPREQSAKSTFSLHVDGSIRLRYPEYQDTEEEQKFGEDLTRKLETIPCFANISARITDGEKTPKWIAEEWLLFSKEFLKIIKDTCVTKENSK